MKTGLIFIFLSIYIIAAFAWWTFAHIRDRQLIYEEEKSKLELLCYKASIDVNGAIDQELFNDTADVKKYVQIHFPQLEIIFETLSATTFDNFLIRPQKAAYIQIRQKLDRKVWMYALEGLVMMSLLFWGIILIYRSFQNRMSLKKQQSNFLLSITHELKTPLASIKLYLETLRKRKLEPQQTETIIQNSLLDVGRLHGLVENLLMAAQLNNHRYEPDLKEINFSELVQNTIDKFATPRNLHSRIVTHIGPGIMLNADESAIVIILNNLLSNAEKYSPPDAVIEIVLKEDKEHVHLTVCNDGPCIAEKDKKELFEAFYRAGDENTRKTKGTGLGLFIVKNLLAIHGATIAVKDKRPQGSIFDIIFKKHAPHLIG